MSGIAELDELSLLTPEFVFCTVSGSLGDYALLDPVATFYEAEGVTLGVEKILP